MSYTSQPQGQNKYSRREFLRTSSAAATGTGLILATDGLTGMLAQEKTSKSREITELLENNENVFGRHIMGQHYGPNSIHQIIDLPKLPKDQHYATRVWEIRKAKFQLPNYTNVTLTYMPAQRDKQLWIVNQFGQYVRDTNIKVSDDDYSQSNFIIDVGELDFTTIKGVQIPITISTHFVDNNLDGIPDTYSIYKTAGPQIPEGFRNIPAEIDQATANAKFNETLDSLLQKVRSMVQQAK